MPTSNNQAWYLGDNAGDLAYLHSVVGEQNIVSILRLSDAPPSVPVLLVIDVDVVADWEHQLSDVDIGSAKIALVSSASMSQVFVRSMYGESPRRWYLGRLVPGTLPDSFVRSLGACLHSENEVMRLELSVLRGKLESLEEERDSSAGSELKLRGQIEESREVLAKLTADLEKLSLEKSEAESQFVVVEQKLAATERSLLDSREAGDHSRKLVADVQDELTTLRTERAALAQISEEKESAIQELSQLLGDNKAAVERLKVLNSELAEKLKNSEDESSQLTVRLQDELDRLAAAHESVKEAGQLRDEAIERALLADSERENAEAQRESSNQSAAEATKQKEEAQKLAKEYASKAQESKREAAEATKLAAQLKDDSAKAVGEAESRTLEAYGILAERTEALEEECLLAATLGEENRELQEASRKVQVELEGKEVELSDSLSLAKDLTAKLDIAVVDVQRAQTESLESAERAAMADKAASESASLAEREKAASIKAIARAEEAEVAQADAVERMGKALESLDLANVAKQEIEESFELSQSKIESLGTECQGLISRVDEVNEELSSAVKAHNRSMLAQEEEKSATIERLNLENEQALIEAKADSDAQLARADAESAERLLAQSEHHKNELNEALESSKRASKAQLDLLVEEHRVASVETENRHVEAIAQLNDERDSSLTELATSHAAAISQLNDERDSSLTELAASHAAAISQLNDERDSSLAKMSNSHAETVASLEDDISKLGKAVEAAVSEQYEAEKLRDEARELTAISNTQRDAALAQVTATNQLASEAESRAALAESDAGQAMVALEESRTALDRLKVVLREHESAALSQKESLEERLELLTLELRQRADDALLVIDERDKLSLDLKERSREVERQVALSDKWAQENEYLKHENREISTKLVALESIHSQHEAEFNELRRSLDSAELTLKETSERERSALSSLSDAELRIKRQSDEYEAKISQVVHERSEDKKAMTLDAKELENRLSVALAEVARLKGANTEAVREIASLRADQSQSASIVHPAPSVAAEPVLAEGIKAEVESTVARSPQGADSRTKRLEEELAEANSRLRATSSGVVWSARREPEVKEGLLGRLKGSISRNGDN